MLEITISESEKLLLEKAGFKNVISFCLLLSYGSIQNLEQQKKRVVGNITIPIDTQMMKLTTKKDKHIRIWYSSLDSEDVCTLYFLISYFYKKNIKISICDVTDENHFSLGSYLVNEVKSLTEKTVTISQKEQKKYYDIWKKLVEENNDLRVIDGNVIKSFSFDYLDQKILEVLKQHEKISYWTLIADCMSKRLCGFYIDIIYTSRVDELIKQNIIEICEIRKEQNVIGQWQEQKYLKIKNNND